MKDEKRKLGPYEFRCEKCKKIWVKSARCVAQQAMHNVMSFTCPDCGHKMEVPE